MGEKSIVLSGDFFFLFFYSFFGYSFIKGWRMVKSETRRDAEILVRNPSPRLFGKKFRDSKKVKTNHAKTRFRDLSKTLPRFRDPAKIFRDPRFSRYHSPPLYLFGLQFFFMSSFSFFSLYLRVLCSFGCTSGS